MMRAFAMTQAQRERGWPKAATAKLAAVTDRAVSSHGAHMAAIDREPEQIGHVREAKRNRDIYLEQCSAARHSPDDDRLKELAEEIAVAEAELARLRAASRKSGEQYQTAKAIETNVLDFMASTRPSTVRPAKQLPAPRGARVETVRAEIETIEAEIGKISSAPLPAADLRRMAHRHIDELAANGAPTVWHRTDRTPVSLDTVSPYFVIWLTADLVKARVADLIGEDQPGALSAQEREKRLAALAARKLDLERVEEALIEAAEADGRIIVRRPDADPRAILGVEIVGR